MNIKKTTLLPYIPYNPDIPSNISSGYHTSLTSDIFSPYSLSGRNVRRLIMGLHPVRMYCYADIPKGCNQICKIEDLIMGLHPVRMFCYASQICKVRNVTVRSKGSQRSVNISTNTCSKTFNWLLFDNYYRDIVSQDLIYKQNFHNIMELPKIQKLVINSTSKLFTEDRKNIASTLFGLEIISGQKYKISVAKKSIAGFKIRQEQIIGCKVTLRKHFISYFLDKYRLLILPRYGNFTGCNMKSFDKEANYTLGLNDLLLFPELEAQFSLFENLVGIDLSFVMCKKKQSENLLLLSALQIPIQKK